MNNALGKAKVYQTRGINDATIKSSEFLGEVQEALIRFINKDWGDTPEEDKVLNDESLKYKDRILASYETSKGKIWINAESEDGVDYSTILIMFPKEY